MAHTRVKTPTAAAEFLISNNQIQEDILTDIEISIRNRVSFLIENEQKKLRSFSEKIPLIVNNRLLEEKNIIQGLSSDIKFISQSRINNEKNKLDNLNNSVANLVNRRITYEKNRLNIQGSRIPNLISNKLQTQNLKLSYVEERIKNAINIRMSREVEKLENMTKIVALASPENILKKGYSMTLKNGKVMKDVSDLNKGDKIMTVFENGSVESVVKNIDTEKLF